jgi:hypothetical protein
VSIRLAIVGLPRLLSDLIADAFSSDDAVHVEVLCDDASTQIVGAGASHEVVIVGVTDPWHSALVNSIGGVARPKLFGVRTDGRESWIYRMQPCPQRLGPVTPAQIRTAVLAANNPPA